MSQSEQQRRALLEQMNSRFHETEIPAIHPRYRTSYRNLYESPEQNRAERGSFETRTFICIILFAVFVFMQRAGKDILHVSSTQIVQQIQKNVDIVNMPEDRYQ